jgi:hypothetical protein
MTRAKRVTMGNRLGVNRIAFLKRCTQGFAEVRIFIPVCLDQAKLSLKSGLAEVNIVHLDSGRGAGFGRNDKAARGKRR